MISVSIIMLNDYIAIPIPFLFCFLYCFSFVLLFLFQKTKLNVGAFWYSQVNKCCLMSIPLCNSVVNNCYWTQKWPYYLAFNLNEKVTRDASFSKYAVILFDQA